MSILILILFHPAFIAIALSGQSAAAAQTPKLRLSMGTPSVVPTEALSDSGLPWSPTHVALSSSGSLFLAAPGSCRVAALDKRRRLIAARTLCENSHQIDISAITASAAGQLFVYDRRRGRIHRYGVLNREIVEQADFSAIGGGADICSVGEDVVVLGYHDGTILHRFSDRGRHILSYGEPFGNDALIQRMSVGWGGRIGCADDGSVVTALTSMPLIRSYDASGRRRWEFAIRGFRSVSVEVTSAKAVRLRNGSEGRDIIHSILHINESLVAIQVRHPPKESIAPRPSAHEPTVTTETIVLNVASGSQIATLADVPPAQSAAHGLLGIIEESANPHVTKARLQPFRLIENLQ